MLELLQEQVDEILAEEFPDGLPPSRVDEAVRTRQARMINRDGATPKEETS